MPITAKAHADTTRDWAMRISRGFSGDVFRVVLFATTISLFVYPTSAKHIPTSEQRRKNIDWTESEPDTVISLQNEQMLPVTMYAQVKAIPLEEYKRKIRHINKSEDIIKMFLVSAYPTSSGDVFIPRGKLHGGGMKTSPYNRYRSSHPSTREGSWPHWPSHPSMGGGVGVRRADAEAMQNDSPAPSASTHTSSSVSHSHIPDTSRTPFSSPSQEEGDSRTGRRDRDKSRSRRKEKRRRSRNRDRSRKHRKGRNEESKMKILSVPYRQGDMDKIHAHEMEVKEKTKCGEPVPVVWNFQQSSKKSNKLFFPSCTVYYRCRSDSACCEDGMECQATQVAKITRHFLEMDVTVEYQIGRTVAPRKVQAIVFDNHTECACMPIKRPVECVCPENFKLERPEGNITDCRCVCEETSREIDKACKPLQNGRRRLSKSDIRGIKDGYITPPYCKYGTYDKGRGRCPRKRPRKHLSRIRDATELSSSGTPGVSSSRVPEGSTPDNDELIQNQSGVPRAGQVRLSKERRSVLSLK